MNGVRNFKRCALWLAVLAASILLHHSAVAAESGEAACAGLAQHDFSGDVGAAVTIGKTDYVPAGALPAFCKVSAVIAPAVRVEIRLPADGWTSRLLFAGCGGLCGVLQTEAANDALVRGYATATTDMGHEGSGTEWLDDKAAVEDFMHRATHVSVILGKAVVKAYYGHGQDHAYYRGCSTGGRQGLMEAMRYPDDFDGIIAGAPASYPGVPVELWDRKVNRAADDKDILDEAAFALLHEAAVAKCDPADGVKDGLISNPLGCAFDPGKLQCGAGAHGKCLSPEQVTVARKLYSGPVSQGKKFTTLGMAPGGEMGVAANVVGVDGKPAGIETVLVHYVQLVLGKNATWHDYDFDADSGKQSPTEAIPGLGADGKAMAPFASHAKLLMYSGWNDPLVSPTIPIDFYRKNAAAFGADTAGFLRLFMMPGMGHCRGGDGPDAADWLTAMETWVEAGKPPQSIMSYKTAAPPQGQQATRFPLPPDSIVYARPLFPFPAYAQYSGKGAVTDPASFVPGKVSLKP
jgi:feruloyl esterase